MVRDLEQSSGLSHSLQSSSYPPSFVQTDTLGGAVHKRIDYMVSHMFKQLKEHEASHCRTAQMFEHLLQQLEETVVRFQQSFISREVPIGNVYVQIDADRSVGILHLLWHTISFTMRGNTKPMALQRQGREPIFTGRIVAILGDYQEIGLNYHAQEYPEILEEELASLYIPGAMTQPAVMRFRHRQEEYFFHPAEATQQFLMKILESVCAGGYFHEGEPQKPSWDV